MFDILLVILTSNLHIIFKSSILTTAHIPPFFKLLSNQLQYQLETIFLISSKLYQISHLFYLTFCLYCNLCFFLPQRFEYSGLYSSSISKLQLLFLHLQVKPNIKKIFPFDRVPNPFPFLKMPSQLALICIFP